VKSLVAVTIAVRLSVSAVALAGHHHSAAVRYVGPTVAHCALPGHWEPSASIKSLSYDI
jgi:hypothetical protein